MKKVCFCSEAQMHFSWIQNIARAFYSFLNRDTDDGGHDRRTPPKWNCSHSPIPRDQDYNDYSHNTLVHTHLYPSVFHRQVKRDSCIFIAWAWNTLFSRFFSYSARILHIIRFDKKILWCSVTVHDKRSSPCLLQCGFLR